MGLSVILLLVFLAFTQFTFVVFGNYMEEFSTFGLALYAASCFQFLLYFAICTGFNTVYSVLCEYTNA